MRRIEVRASGSYTITIGSGLLETVGNEVRRVSRAKKVCIVSDSLVWPLYGDLVARGLEHSGLAHTAFVFVAGENSKNTDNYLKLLHHLAQEGLDRSDCILALGGGVVGDLAGFTAATYLRGIPYIQVPTTLLAMVDSSVGGKTAINLTSGKNLCGAFYQPAAVLCDTDCLATLPESVFRDGCAEVIKYGVLYDPILFADLEETGLDFDREAVIARCVEHKREVVMADEYDNAQRRRLNLGHTIGHAIEQCSHYGISHGKAVAIGMSIVCRSSQCPDTARITSLLASFGLPVTTNFSAEALCNAALSDKKRHGEAVDLIIPQSIGNCAIVSTPVENLKSFIEEGL